MLPQPHTTQQPHTAVFLRWYDRIRDSTAKGCRSGQVKATLAAAVMPPLVVSSSSLSVWGPRHVLSILDILMLCEFDGSEAEQDFAFPGYVSPGSDA